MSEYSVLATHLAHQHEIRHVAVKQHSTAEVHLVRCDDAVAEVLPNRAVGEVEARDIEATGTYRIAGKPPRGNTVQLRILAPTEAMIKSGESAGNHRFPSAGHHRGGAARSLTELY